MTLSNDILAFPSLPLWRGVRDVPGVFETFPFSLGVDPRGFLCQSTSSDLRRRIARAYADPGYLFITPPPGSSQWADSLGLTKLHALLAACASLDDARVLEIGAGNLTIAHELTSRFSVERYVAVDPTLPVGEGDRIETLRSFFPSKDLAGDEFDLVVGFSCLEHVEDPVEFMVAAAKNLAPNGRIFLTFPDVGAMLRRGDLNALVHEHLSYFDEAGFRRAARLADLEVLSLMERRGLFSALLCAGATSAELAALNPSIKASIRHAYEVVIEKFGLEIRTEFARGTRIAFHGACPGLLNFLWLAGFAGDERIVIADSDRSKWGRFVPTSPSAIRAPDDPAYLASDRIYVAATNFFAEIKASLVEKGVAKQAIMPLLVPGFPL